MREISIPDEIYELLKSDAQRKQRSVEEHLRYIIEHVYPTREAELARLRAIMGDDLESPATDLLPRTVRPLEIPIDHRALRASMPTLDPPLSATIVSDRDDRV
jgi:hypothetical protein